MIFKTKEDLTRFLTAEDEVTKTGFDSYTDPVKRDAEKLQVIAFRQSMVLHLLDETTISASETAEL